MWGRVSSEGGLKDFLESRFSSHIIKFLRLLVVRVFQRLCVGADVEMPMQLWHDETLTAVEGESRVRRKKVILKRRLFPLAEAREPKGLPFSTDDGSRTLPERAFDEGKLRFSGRNVPLCFLILSSMQRVFLYQTNSLQFKSLIPTRVSLPA